MNKSNDKFISSYFFGFQKNDKSEVNNIIKLNIIILFLLPAVYASTVPVTHSEIFLAIADAIVSETPENPIKNSSLDLEHIGIAIPVSLTNISKLNKATSRQFYVGGVKWRIQAEKTINSNNITSIALYLEANDDDLSNGLSFATKVDSKLLPVISSYYPIARNLQFNCYWGASKIEIIKISSSSISYDYQSYIHRDNMSFLISLKAEKSSIWDDTQLI